MSQAENGGSEDGGRAAKKSRPHDFDRKGVHLTPASSGTDACIGEAYTCAPTSNPAPVVAHRYALRSPASQRSHSTEDTSSEVAYATVTGETTASGDAHNAVKQPSTGGAPTPTATSRAPAAAAAAAVSRRAPTRGNERETRAAATPGMGAPRCRSAPGARAALARRGKVSAKTATTTTHHPNPKRGRQPVSPSSEASAVTVPVPAPLPTAARLNSTCVSVQPQNREDYTSVAAVAASLPPPPMAVSTTPSLSLSFGSAPQVGTTDAAFLLGEQNEETASQRPPSIVLPFAPHAGLDTTATASAAAIVLPAAAGSPRSRLQHARINDGNVRNSTVASLNSVQSLVSDGAASVDADEHACATPLITSAGSTCTAKGDDNGESQVDMANLLTYELDDGTVVLMDATATPEDLICGICMSVCCRPTATSCGHLFCHACLATWIQSNNPGNSSCPLDRTPLGQDSLHADARAQRQINALQCRCPGTLSLRGQQQLRGGDVDAEAAVQTESKETDAGRASARCSWHGCVSDAAAHLQGCPHVLTPCPFAEHGCTAVVSRADIPQHAEAATQEHLLLLSRAFSASAEQVRVLQEEVSLLHQRCPLSTVSHAYPSQVSNSGFVVAHNNTSNNVNNTPSHSQPMPLQRSVSMSLSSQTLLPALHTAAAGNNTDTAALRPDHARTVPVAAVDRSNDNNSGDYSLTIVTPFPANTMPEPPHAQSLTAYAPLSFFGSGPTDDPTSMAAPLRHSWPQGIVHASPTLTHDSPLHFSSPYSFTSPPHTHNGTNNVSQMSFAVPLPGPLTRTAMSPDDRAGVTSTAPTSYAVRFVWIITDAVSRRAPCYSRPFHAHGLAWYLGMDCSAASEQCGVFLFPANGHRQRIDFRIVLYNDDPARDVVQVVRDWQEDYIGKGWGPLRFVDRRTIGPDGFLPQGHLRIGVEILGEPF